MKNKTPDFDTIKEVVEYYISNDCADKIDLDLGKFITALERCHEDLIENLEIVEEGGYYKKGDLEKFFGCAKGLTGGLNSREYILGIRDEE